MPARFPLAFNAYFSAGGVRRSIKQFYPEFVKVREQTHKLHSIQVFRGLAALLVLLFHASQVSRYFLDYDLMNGIFSFGYSGVDFFFVLSGFVIFLAHRRDLGCPARIKPYLAKRFIRIYPLFWIVALILLPIYFGMPRSFTDYIAVLKALILFPQSENALVIVAWTLAYEVFFYVIFGLAIYFRERFTRPVFLVWLVITALVYLGKLLTSGSFRLPAHSDFVFSSYHLEFAFGCLAAYLIGRYPLIKGGRIVVIGATIFLLSGLNDDFLHSHFNQRHVVMCYGFSSMLVVWGVALREQRSKILMPAPLLLLGDASYSIYLTHYALLDLFARGSLVLNIPAMIGKAPTAMMVVAFSLGGGFLFYLCVERPLLAYLRTKLHYQPDNDSGASEPLKSLVP